MPQRNKISFSVSFVALSHCAKQKFSLLHWITATYKKNYLWHWVTATNKICICCQKIAKIVNNAQLFGTFMALFDIFWDFCAFFFALLRTLLGTSLHFCLLFFAIFWQHIQILFVSVTQCDKQKFCVSQWLCATKKLCLLQWVSAINNTEKNIQFICCI